MTHLLHKITIASNQLNRFIISIVIIIIIIVLLIYLQCGLSISQWRLNERLVCSSVLSGSWSHTGKLNQRWSEAYRIVTMRLVLVALWWHDKRGQIEEPNICNYKITGNGACLVTPPRPDSLRKDNFSSIYEKLLPGTTRTLKIFVS